MDNPDQSDAPPTTFEISSQRHRNATLILVALLALIAFALRAWNPQRMAIEHFDEGVYASNYYSAHLDFRYPDQHLYAPPLLPALLDWTIFITGGNPHSVIWVNVILGTGLVLAIWWLTRLISGDVAAIAAMTLATFSDFLIEYSRAALTDTPVALFMVLAVGTGLIALRDRRTAAMIAAGIFTALAWWTKYNGWLPIAILGAGLAGWVVCERPKFRELLPRVIVFVVITAIALALWSPCLWTLQQYGGYAAVAKNHAGYVVGFNGWWDSAIRQYLIQSHAMSPLTLIGVFTAMLIAATCAQSGSKIDHRKIRYWFVIAASLLLIVKQTGFALLCVMAVIGVFELRRQLANSREKAIGWWILLAWMAGLFVSTPLYRPYPRLGMPLLIVVLITAAVGFLKLATDGHRSQSQLEKVSRISLCFGICIVSAIVASACLIKCPHENRSGLLNVSREIIDQISMMSEQSGVSGVDAVVYVIGEPGLYYHLASQQNPNLRIIANPATNLGMLQPGATPPEIPTYIALGLHADAEKIKLADQSDRAEFVAAFEYQASDLVLLDNVPPQELEANRQQSIELWKIKFE